MWILDHFDWIFYLFDYIRVYTIGNLLNVFLKSDYRPMIRGTLSLFISSKDGCVHVDSEFHHLNLHLFVFEILAIEFQFLVFKSEQSFVLKTQLIKNLSQSYQTFFFVKRIVFSGFLLLCLAILMYRQYFPVLQTLKLNNENLKNKEIKVLWDWLLVYLLNWIFESDETPFRVNK
jgi:hypothetical protein